MHRRGEMKVLPQDGLPVQGEPLLSMDLHDVEKKGIEKHARKNVNEANDLQIYQE